MADIDPNHRPAQKLARTHPRVNPLYKPARPLDAGGNLEIPQWKTVYIIVFKGISYEIMYNHALLRFIRTASVDGPWKMTKKPGT